MAHMRAEIEAVTTQNRSLMKITDHQIGQLLRSERAIRELESKVNLFENYVPTEIDCSLFYISVLVLLCCIFYIFHLSYHHINRSCVYVY